MGGLPASDLSTDFASERIAFGPKVLEAHFAPMETTFAEPEKRLLSARIFRICLGKRSAKEPIGHKLLIKSLCLMVSRP